MFGIPGSQASFMYIRSGFPPPQRITRSTVLEIPFGAWSKCGMTDDPEIIPWFSRIPTGISAKFHVFQISSMNWGGVQL